SLEEPGDDRRGICGDRAHGVPNLRYTGRRAAGGAKARPDGYADPDAAHGARALRDRGAVHDRRNQDGGTITGAAAAASACRIPGGAGTGAATAPARTPRAAVGRSPRTRRYRSRRPWRRTAARSEERRAGKEGRSRGPPHTENSGLG